MKRVAVTTGIVLLLVCTESHAQSAAVTPAADAAIASQKSCVILKRIGRMGRTESRLTHFGISGKQFRYVEGKMPEGFSFREKMNENNVRNLQARGTQVLVLDSHYTADDLKEARADCQRGSGKAASQVEAKAQPAPARGAAGSAPVPAGKPAPATESIASPPAPAAKPATANASTHDKAPPSRVPTSKADDSSSMGTAEPAASTPAPTPKPPAANVPSTDKTPSVKTSTPTTEDPAPSAGTTVAALLDVSSTPTGADVYVDDHLSGHTPATTIILAPGDHKIAVKKSGFVVWQKKLKLPSGPTNVNAELLPKSK